MAADLIWYLASALFFGLIGAGFGVLWRDSHLWGQQRAAQDAWLAQRRDEVRVDRIAYEIQTGRHRVIEGTSR